MVVTPTAVDRASRTCTESSAPPAQTRSARALATTSLVLAVATTAEPLPESAHAIVYHRCRCSHSEALGTGDSYDVVRDRLRHSIAARYPR